jgi:hypothetical protein
MHKCKRGTFNVLINVESASIAFIYRRFGIILSYLKKMRFEINAFKVEPFS